MYSFDLYKKIANDLLKFPKKIEVLRLYKDGEPLINKNFVDMIKYAKDIGASNRIDTTTNAALLSPKLGREIALAGLDRINISIEGINNEQYKKF
jgi:molybdenum cofactor biosynthesis enzyme MoaA